MQLFVGWINNKVLCVEQGTVDPEQGGNKAQAIFSCVFISASSVHVYLCVQMFVF